MKQTKAHQISVKEKCTDSSRKQVYDPLRSFDILFSTFGELTKYLYVLINRLPFYIV